MRGEVSAVLALAVGPDTVIARLTFQHIEQPPVSINSHTALGRLVSISSAQGPRRVCSQFPGTLQ